jgi:hypothetical protein
MFTHPNRVKFAVTGGPNPHVAEATSLKYFPGGYPALGLVPRTVVLRYRKDANLRNLRRRLEKWEAAHGNPKFQARHLEKLNTKLAFELVNVYVALRERFPTVKPDYIDFVGDTDPGSLAEAIGYGDNFPTMRSLVSGYDYDVIDPETVLMMAEMEDLDPDALKALRSESLFLGSEGAIDPANTGCIIFGSTFANSRHYRKLLKFWQLRNERAVARGQMPRVVWSAVSVASLTLIHEFGHLVEAELSDLGYDAVESVYASLTSALLEVDSPEDTQWRFHLVNYPTYTYTSVKGRYEGGELRRKATRKALHDDIRAKVGTYATTSRDEMFAECFAHALGGARLRRELRPLLAALKEQGLMARRLPRR